MLKILIVDDEIPARSRLKRLLKALPGCSVAGEAGSGIEALAEIRRLRPDVLLLDISMPGLDGMALAGVLKEAESAPAIIFCTAWPDQALDAFDSGAVDYVVKPVRSERLAAALEKAARFIGHTGPESYLSCIIGGRTQLISLDAIICLMAEDKYTTVHLENEQKVINASLVEIEDQHGDRFIRVHRNALVARDRIRGLDRVESGATRVVLEGCDIRPVVSRRLLPAVRQIIRELQ